MSSPSWKFGGQWCEAGVRQRLPDDLVAGSGRREARVVAQGGRHEHRVLRYPGRAAVPAGEVDQLEVGVARQHLAPGGRKETEDQVGERRLAGSTRTDEGGRRRREQFGVDVGEAVRAVVAPATVTPRSVIVASVACGAAGPLGVPASGACAARLRDGGEARECRAGIGGLVVAGAEPAHRGVELRREHQCREDRRQLGVAEREPHAAEHGDERGPEHRDQLEDEAGDERTAQRRHRLLAVHARGGTHLRALEPGAPVRPQIDESAEDVEEVRAELLEARQPLVRDAAGFRSDEPHEHAEQGDRRSQEVGGEVIREEHRDDHDDRRCGPRSGRRRGTCRRSSRSTEAG